MNGGYILIQLDFLAVSGTGKIGLAPKAPLQSELLMSGLAVDVWHPASDEVLQPLHAQPVHTHAFRCRADESVVGLENRVPMGTPKNHFVIFLGVANNFAMGIRVAMVFHPVHHRA